MNSTRGTGVLLLFVLAWWAAPAHAQHLAGADLEFGRLYDVDPATGATSNARPTGIPLLTGIAYSPAGVLYGISNRDAVVNPNSLFRIDPATGASTVVGPTGLRAIVEGDLAFNPATGVLYGVTNVETAAREMFTINPATGVATIVGPVSASANIDPSALEFLPDGRLVMIDSLNDRLLTVDPATAAIVSSVPLSSPLGVVAGLALDPSTRVLYAADGGIDGTRSLYRLDATSGQLTLIGPTPGAPFGLSSLEFIPEPAAPALLAAAGMLALRRRRR
jgi:DNA-binding beta-propeller fold protein YncE